MSNNPITTTKDSQSDNRWASGEQIPDVLTAGDPRLRQIACEYDHLKELAPLCQRMVEMLRQLNGAGLAASQIGSQEPVIVVEVRKTNLFPDRPESPLYIMIQPKIETFAGPTELEWEGCFSVPGIMAKVPRPRDITVSWTELDGTKRRENFSGYVARVVQHEYDHLNGVLFTDRMDPLTLTTVANWKRAREAPPSP